MREKRENSVEVSVMTFTGVYRRLCFKLGLNLIVTNVNKTKYSKNCLLSYITHPFQNKKSQDAHQNIWQVKEIARIIGEFGYNVDVVDYRENRVKLRKNYDLVFDILASEEPIYKNNLNPEAKRIIFFTGSESDFANSAEIKRLSDLEKRRGVSLQPRRQAPPIVKEVENYDSAIMIGNDYNFDTYSKFDLKKRFIVPNTGYDFGNRFDFSKKDPKNFLYFGSAGCVHKGLDLLLEIFSEKDFPANLYVCGGFKSETDFEQEYSKELYNTPNIIPVGITDIWGDDFTELASKCAFSILPSCSEGLAGSVTTTMSAGIINICSDRCGFDSDDVIILKDCSKEFIRNTILEYSQKSMEWITSESEREKKLTETKFSKSEFTRSMKEAIGATINE